MEEGGDKLRSIDSLVVCCSKGVLREPSQQTKASPENRRRKKEEGRGQGRGR